MEVSLVAGRVLLEQVEGPHGSWRNSWEGPAEAGERAPWKSAQQLKGPAEAAYELEGSC